MENGFFVLVNFRLKVQFHLLLDSLWFCCIFKALLLSVLPVFHWELAGSVVKHLGLLIKNQIHSCAAQEFTVNFQDHIPELLSLMSPVVSLLLELTFLEAPARNLRL
jgi:hypothetical protein